MSPSRTNIVTVTLVAIILSGCTAPDPKDSISPQSVSGGSGGTGGSVSASAPSVQTFSSDRTSGDNGGSFVVIFSGTIFSPNGERRLASVTVNGTGPSTLTGTHTITNAEATATTEPASFGSDGFKVWDAGAAKDGVLSFKYQQPFAVWTASGSYSFVATAKDDANLVSAASSAITITLSKFSLVTVAGAPVNAAGAAQTGASWGGWTAAPGATNVAGTNYLKLVNDGDKPAVSVVISFSSASFAGATDANYSIPIHNNIQFSWAEGAPSATPSTLNMTYGATSASGSVTVSFTAKSNVVYVGYRLVSLPSVLDKQSYAAAFTVTEI